MHDASEAQFAAQHHLIPSIRSAGPVHGNITGIPLQKRGVNFVRGTLLMRDFFETSPEFLSAPSTSLSIKNPQQLPQPLHESLSSSKSCPTFFSSLDIRRSKWMLRNAEKPWFMKE
jgi:hypothetical protein